MSQTEVSNPPPLGTENPAAVKVHQEFAEYPSLLGCVRSAGSSAQEVHVSLRIGIWRAERVKTFPSNAPMWSPISGAYLFKLFSYLQIMTLVMNSARVAEHY